MNKFFVVKQKDADKYLTDERFNQLISILDDVERGRSRDSKPIKNQYVVINLDEPYADEVTRIMRDHGHDINH